jgi:hypothetical protein
MAGLISPIVDPESERIAEQMAYANALRKKGMEMDTGARMVGPVFTVGNALGPVAQMLGGQYLASKTRDEQTALAGARQAQRDQFLQQMPQATHQTPTPELNDQGAPVMAETPRDAREYARDMENWTTRAMNVPGMEGIGAYGLQQKILAPEKQADRELQGDIATKQLLIKSMEAKQAREEADARRLESDKIFKMTAKTQEELRRAQIEAEKQRIADKAAAAQEKVDTKKLAADEAKQGGIDLAQQQLYDIDKMIGTFDPNTGERLTAPHGGFGGYVGATLLPFKRMIEGTDEATYETIHNRVKSQARGEGIKMLKGTGSVSNAEGAAMADAITSINKAQNEKEYTDAMRSYRQLIQRGMERAQKGITIRPDAPLTGYEKYESKAGGQQPTGGSYEQTKTIPGKGTFGLRNGQWYQVQ